jgi:hypothetical protein
MRVPDYILSCVGFVSEYYQSPTGGSDTVDPEGSGFFVHIPFKNHPARDHFVFVTAKHVAMALKDKKTAITTNHREGGIAVLDIGDEWYCHPDESVDVAIVSCDPGQELDIKSVPVDMFINNEIIENEQIGIGDEVYLPGLFTHAANEKRNIPILRHGNIAMIPPEAIQVDGSFAEVYLIEARSIGGISGSPVFVRGTVVLKDDKGEGIIHGLSNMNYLFGLIHGHWDIKESEMNKATYTHDRQRGVNLGIAVVVPASKILEVINHPDLVKIRSNAEMEYAKAVSPGPDWASA